MERTTQTRVTGIPRWATAQVRILHTQRAQCEAEQASFADTHIKKAESRKRMHLQQSASKELVVNLAKLYGAHLRTERRKLGVCLLPRVRGDVSRSGRALNSRSVHLRLQLRPHGA